MVIKAYHDHCSICRLRHRQLLDETAPCSNGDFRK
jgi:hypothetical protein